MKTITDRAEISTAFSNFTADRDGAYPTSRCMPAPLDNSQEWAEHGSIKGVPAKVYYIFEDAEVEGLEADSYPWGEASISKIEIAEQDQDGDYDEL